jgi:hypothetical protein
MNCTCIYRRVRRADGVLRVQHQQRPQNGDIDQYANHLMILTRQEDDDCRFQACATACVAVVSLTVTDDR